MNRITCALAITIDGVIVKYLDEFRYPPAVAALAQRLADSVTQPWTIMEVCGGQTNAILKYGLDELLPHHVTLVHGPGCPVCVTPVSVLDHAMAIAAIPGVILATFADMLRVPGSSGDLNLARSRGADVRPVYSPLDAVNLAMIHPDKQVVFFAVGFETTAPATALSVIQASRLRLANFSILAAHVLVAPAMEAVLDHPENRVQGFLAAGHVCTVTGYSHYTDMTRRFGVPIVVTGFEPLDLLDGISTLLQLLEAGTPKVLNRYSRAVASQTGSLALDTVWSVYDRADIEWRGLGQIPQSGLRLNSHYNHFDAAIRFPRHSVGTKADDQCQAGLVLQGRLSPDRCPSYGTICTPAAPLGAPMVSAEGACAAYWNAGRPPRSIELVTIGDT